jgi:geranylgeranyl reductase family protein
LKCDVVVVGAGPAGSTASIFLAKKGFKVIMVDKAKFPRIKACGGGIPVSVFKRLPFLKKYDLVDCYSHGGFVYSSSLKSCAKLESADPVVAFVSRDAFDQKLALIAVDHGVEFYDGKRVKDIHFSDDKVKVILDDETTIDSDVVVGADGVSSIVAQKAGLASKNKLVNVCVFQEYKLNEKILSEYTTEKHLCYIHMVFNNIPGYAWLFPKKDCFNIGIGEFIVLKKPGLKINLVDAYKSYFDLLQKEKLIPFDLKTGKVKGGCVPVYLLKKTYSDRVVLCGDAGGFINPVSGGGIYYAMVSGENAASVICNAFENENFSSSFLSDYQNLWMNEFGKDLRTLSRISNFWLKNSEKFIKIISKDSRLTDIASSFLYGNLQMRDYRGKLISYYIQDRIKDALGLL